MTEPDTDATDTANRRRSDRADLNGKVTVQFPSEPLVGPGENISEAGVFFVIDGSLRVQVQIEGREGAIEGELVRIQALSERGGAGIAIRFLEPQPGLVSS